MIENNTSWAFLFDFFLSDRDSIVSLINKAIGVRTKLSVSQQSFELFMGDILSFLPYKGVELTYRDYLQNVFPQASREGISGEQELESAFLNHVWLNILSNSSAYRYFSQDLRLLGVSNVLKPYLILYSFGIEADWFLYGGKSKESLVDSPEKFPLLLESLTKGYKSWFRIFSYHKWIPRFTKRFSLEQLYPLTTLLIVLKREWTESIKESYLTQKYNSLRKCGNKESIYKSLIYGIYNHFIQADPEIKKELLSEDVVTFHPLIAKHIIESSSYKSLFDSLEDAERISIPKGKLYEYAEDTLGDSYTGKRLLLDYLFPFTKVRPNDIFVPTPTDSLTNKIYISLNVGSNFSKIWRYPDEREFFDCIQIDPLQHSETFEYDDIRVSDYRQRLTPEGTFLVIRPKEEDMINQKLKNAFSAFRHDLKDIIKSGTDNIDVMQKEIADLNDNNIKFNTLINRANKFLEAKSNEEVLQSLRETLKELDNDKSIQKLDEFPDMIYKMRDIVEEYCHNKEVDIDESLTVYVSQIKDSLANMIFDSLSKNIELMQSIKFNHENLCNYIRIAGTTDDKKNDYFDLKDFLDKYKECTSLNNKRAQILTTCPESGCMVKYNRVILTIMLNSIIGNAFDHGFKDYQCDSPKIELSLSCKNDTYYILKVCNNGRPIDITEKEYKTRGVFSGITGHTGLGGYQVSKYAEQLGGFIKLPTDKKWNTEIHIYIPK